MEISALITKCPCRQPTVATKKKYRTNTKSKAPWQLRARQFFHRHGCHVERRLTARLSYGAGTLLHSKLLIHLCARARETWKRQLHSLHILFLFPFAFRLVRRRSNYETCRMLCKANANFTSNKLWRKKMLHVEFETQIELLKRSLRFYGIRFSNQNT